MGITSEREHTRTGSGPPVASDQHPLEAPPPWLSPHACSPHTPAGTPWTSEPASGPPTTGHWKISPTKRVAPALPSRISPVVAPHSSPPARWRSTRAPSHWCSIRSRRPSVLPVTCEAEVCLVYTPTAAGLFSEEIDVLASCGCYLYYLNNI